MPQPPSQPAYGPNARVVQVKVVPQSGSARLSCANATAMAIIGRKASTIIAGAWEPMAMTMKPSVAVALYAGAVAARPMTTLDSRPIAEPRKPLSTGPSMGWVVAVAVVMVALPRPGFFDAESKNSPTPQSMARNGHALRSHFDARFAPWHARRTRPSVVGS